MQSTLILSDYKLAMQLGWGDDERSILQEVSLDIEIVFANTPLACESDELPETLCYDKLTQAVKAQLVSRPYHLLEHVTHDVYTLIMQRLKLNDWLCCRVAKVPPIDGLAAATFQLTGEKGA